MRIKKTSQYIEGGASLSNEYGTSNENGYTQNYSNNNFETKSYEYTNVGGGIRTFKKGNMVFVIGGIAVNSATKTIQLPYTSKYEIHIPTTGYYNQNDNMQGYGFGRMLSGSKDLVLKYNNAVTIACINFAYYTED